MGSGLALLAESAVQCLTMGTGARWACMALLFAAASAPASAQAFEYVSVGGGFMGIVGGNFIDKPGDQTIPINGQDVSDVGAVPEYPGFAGVARGFGFFVDFRVMDYLGLEFDVLPMRGSGKADLKVTYFNTGTGAAESHEFSAYLVTDAWHLPLLIKGILPTELVSPSLFLGPEFVIPEDIVDGGPATEISGDDPHTIVYSATADFYTMFTFGIGMEFNLPFPADWIVQASIPLTIRGSYNPGVSDKRSERANYIPANEMPREVQFKTEWQWQAIATLGAQVMF